MALRPMRGRRSIDGIGNGPDAALDSSEDDRPYRERLPGVGFITAIVLFFVVSIAAVSAFLLLTGYTDNPMTPVLQDFMRTAYQALAVGLLGGLAKQLIERRAGQQKVALALRDRRYTCIDALVSANHSVENARLLIRANRSVTTWTEQMNGSVVPARTQMRLLFRNLENWENAKPPIFKNACIKILAECMSDYLMDLINEYAENKQELSELQRRAEHADQRTRLELLNETWDRLQRLDLLGDCIHDGDRYDRYHKTYLTALELMRRELSSRYDPKYRQT
jgi:hypothetical protein